jgi:hypothetical protein
MSYKTKIRTMLDIVLKPLNVRLASLTSENVETGRLCELKHAGHFEKPIFPILPQFKDCDPSPIFEQIGHDESRFAEIVDPTNTDGFRLDNDYYTTPDAEVLYAVVQLYRPNRIIEVGSGNSTQLFRIAINDAGLKTHLTSIDPHPRKDISRHSDNIIRERVENVEDLAPFRDLGANDILFIDSSHELKPGNDVLCLLLTIMPQLRPGVIIHIHDIFLPFEYPKKWILELGWDFFKEQYLVQGLLAENPHFEVLWAGYYLQRSVTGFAERFKQWHDVDARSLWLRRV